MHHVPFYVPAKWKLLIRLNVMWGFTLISCYLDAPLNFAKHEPLAYHMPCIILRIALLVLICALYFFVCDLLLRDRRRYRGVPRGVCVLPRGGYRLCLYRWSCRRALPPSPILHFSSCYLFLPLYCDSFESRILFHLFTILSRVSLPLPIRCCLLFDKPCES
jgi:uncharacterized membrane protein YhdT